jgi:hypothetical protein
MIKNLPFAAPTNYEFKNLNILKLDDLIQLNQTKIGFLADKQKLPTNLQCNFNKVNNVHNYHTRSQNNFYIKNYRHKPDLLSKYMLLFNELHEPLRVINKIESFRKKLKDYIISMY